jgi:hypothetical protein
MNTLDKLVGTSGCILVTGATKVVFPTGYAAYSIVVAADATEVASVDQLVAGAPAALTSASWNAVALTRGDYIAFENPIISITLNAAGDSVFCYLQPCDYVEPPTAFSATIDSGVTIDLDWTNNTNDDGIVIERSLDEVTWVVAATVAKDPTPVVTYADTDLEEETEYFYRARAFHGNNYSTYTATDDATTLTI